MRYKIIIVFVFFLLVPLCQDRALAFLTYEAPTVTYEGAPLGSQLNPINITTGGYNGTYYSGAPIGSKLNPIYIRNNPGNNYNGSFKATSKTILDEVCEKTSGINSYYTNETDVNKGGGSGGCGCKPGYRFDKGSYGTCVLATETNDQVCQDRFGIYSEWGGTINSKNELVCRCKDGYSSDSALGTNLCLLTTVAPTKTNDQICQTDYGIYSRWDGTKNNKGGLNCNCKPGYEWDSSITQCNAIPIKTSKMQGGGSSAQIQKVDPATSFVYKQERSKPYVKNMKVVVSTKLRTCPNEICESLGVYPVGTLFNVTNRYDAVFVWYKGTTPDGKNGWFFTDMLKELPGDGITIVGTSTNNGLSDGSTTILSATSTPIEKTEKKGFWAKVKGLFGF